MPPSSKAERQAAFRQAEHDIRAEADPPGKGDDSKPSAKGKTQGSDQWTWARAVDTFHPRRIPSIVHLAKRNFLPIRTPA